MTLQEAINANIAAAVSAALGPIRTRLDMLEAKPALSDADRALLDQLAAYIGAPVAPAGPDGADAPITLPDINP